MGWALVIFGFLLAAPAPMNAEEKFLISAAKLLVGVALIIIGVNILAP